MKNAKLIHSVKVDGFRVILLKTEHTYQVIVRNQKGGSQRYRFSTYRKAYEFFCHACETLSTEKPEINQRIKKL